jgi:hypothetical protein
MDISGSLQRPERGTMDRVSSTDGATFPAWDRARAGEVSDAQTDVVYATWWYALLLRSLVSGHSLISGLMM